MIVLSVFSIASHKRGRPRHRQRLVPRHPLVRRALRHRPQPRQERQLRFRRRRPQVPIVHVMTKKLDQFLLVNDDYYFKKCLDFCN